MSASKRAPRVQIGIAVATVAAIALCAIAWIFVPVSFHLAYLAAVLVPWSVSLGSLSLALTFVLTGGKWGRACWPWLVLNARLMPLVAILFIPWFIGINDIYPWTKPDFFASMEHTSHRQWFYQTPFYIGRTIGYFVIWSILGWMISSVPGGRRRQEADLAPSEVPSRSMIGGQPAAGLGLIAIILSVTWAGMDWVMSFDPLMGSTLFGGMIGIGAVLCGMSAVVAAICCWPPLHGTARDDKTFGDISNLLLAFLMFWAYFSFAHFLIMWNGNFPTEALFYGARVEGIWGWITPILALGGFVLPFLCLLSHDFKRSRIAMGTLAIGLIFVRLIELWWMVLPAAGDSPKAGFHWTVIPTTVAAAGIYLLTLDLIGRGRASSLSREGRYA